MVRAGIRKMLSETSGRAPCEVDEADTTEDAVEMTLRVGYDVVLMDYNMPGIGGDKATRQILERRPEACILGLSNYEDRTYVERMIQAGARGYIVKSIEADTLYGAIRTVMSGKPYYSNEVALQWMGAGMFPRTRDPMDRLTSREREVFRLVLTGLNDREIGAKMFLSPRTVEKHRHNSMAKLGAHNAVELVLVAQRMGMKI